MEEEIRTEKKDFKEIGKEVVKETWNTVKRPLLISGVFLLGTVVGDKYCLLKTGSGLERMHNAGVLKFFDPATGNEVNPEQVIEVCKRVFNLKK